jgi:hypothetical protein
MFALEDVPFVRFFPFTALFPDADVRLNSVRPRPAASSLPAGAELTRSPRNWQTPVAPSLWPGFTATETALPS